MNEKINLVVGQSLQETMEEMAFIELVPALLKNDGEIWREAAIDTLDEWAGRLWLRIEHGLLQETIENIYAIEREEISAEIERDALAEILNTLAGKALRRLTEDERGFRLSLPFEGQLERQAGENSAVFECDGRKIEVIWQKKCCAGGD